MSHMQQDLDWQLVKSLLPPAWQAKAHELCALQRQGILGDPDILLRVLLAHVARGLSLAETAVRVQEAGWGQVSAVALWKRLRASEQWLRFLSQSFFERLGHLASVSTGRLLAVDATIVREPGATGSLWRVHWMVELANLQCQHYELTDAHQAETLCRYPLCPGDVVLADRGYSLAKGIGYVVSQKACIIVRVNTGALLLYSKPKQIFKLPGRLRSLQPGQAAQWPVWIQAPDNSWIAGRLVARRLSRNAARIARQKLYRQASRKQRKPSAKSLELAGYQLIWTNLDTEHYPYRRVLELYRLRWQIELVFKRMKSIMGLGHLPKHSDPASRAWLHAKLLVVLLIERLWEKAQRASPWGLCRQIRCSRWRESQYLLHELSQVLLPSPGLIQTLRHWEHIARRLAEPHRNRARQRP